MAVTFDEPRLNEHTQKHEVGVKLNDKGISVIRQLKGNDNCYRINKSARRSLNVPVMLGTLDELKSTLRRVHVARIMEETYPSN